MPLRRLGISALALATLPVGPSACSSPRDGADQPRAERQAPVSPIAAPAQLRGREWRLLAFGDRPAPLGGGGKPATLSFDLPDGRAGGFAGCNGFSSSYTIAGDSLSFGRAVATLMACTEGMELENRYLEALQAVRRYSIEDSMLVLWGADRVVARFQ